MISSNHQGMGHRESISGAEYDALPKYRKWFCYLSRSGVASGIKRAIRRRERRGGKLETSEDAD